MTNLGGQSLPTILVIFGATGDLARRKLIPALWRLHHQKLLPSMFQVVGFSRRDWSDEKWQREVVAILSAAFPNEDRAGLEQFSTLFAYRSGVFEDIAGYKKLSEFLGRQDDQWHTCANKLFYLAVPPQYYQRIFQNLADSGLTEPCSPEEGWTRVIVEKPFGRDLATAQELDEMLGRLFREEQIYRIDHYLAKDTVQNILAFRFSNTFLDPAWDARSIADITIQFLEEEGVDGRGELYDELGTLRDVGQNHMLQLLALFTMEKPSSFSADAIRQARTTALEALQVMDQQEIVRQTVRGQYEGYRDTDGVQPNSQTETYFKLQTHLNTARWRGVPIYLESGRRASQEKIEATITFRHHTPCLCPPGVHYANVLHYRIQPKEGISTSFWVKKPGDKMVLEERDFTFDYHSAFQKEHFVDPYTKLLLDAFRGDQTLFVSTPEILASWRFVDAIISGWQKGLTPLVSYKKGVLPTWPPLTDGVKIPHKEIGYIGLGKMGSNMVARLVDHGWKVIATDPSNLARRRVSQIGAKTVAAARDVVTALAAPRLVWIMVPHEVVDDVLKEISPLLAKGDTVIDGSNSLYKDSVRRARELGRRGIRFLDVGVSGGPSGARAGACLMIGGSRQAYKMFSGLFSDLATAGGYDYMGESGAGHFVKMVHNGIEYGMMQALAEGFAVLKKWPAKLDLERIANVFNHGSVIESKLVGWLRDAYANYGPDLTDITGSVAQTGEGAWTIEAAKELGIPVPIIKGALQFRIDSQDQPSYTGQILSALRGEFGGHEVKKSEARNHES